MSNYRLKCLSKSYKDCLPVPKKEPITFGRLFDGELPLDWSGMDLTRARSLEHWSSTEQL